MIGNIIEHPTQNPKEFKRRSRAELQAKGQLKPDRTKPFEVEYKPIYYMQEGQTGTSMAEILKDDLPISKSEVDSNQWLNMDTIECDKMEWMTSRADRVHQERLNISTQFDRDGKAVPKEMLQVSKVKSEESNTNPNKKLVEVGETHDIEALIQMLDSAYDPQVTYALNVIGKIANLASVGYYDGAFDENIYTILIKNCLLRVRHQLDNTNETVCQAALKCLSALLCNTRIDEVILDRIFPLNFDEIDPNMWLQTSEMSDKKFTIEMKDIECVEIDAIAALVERTDLLTRFIYLLQAKVTTPGYLAYQECILDILIRMARHSKNLCYRMSKIDLLSILVNERFLPINPSSVGKYTVSLAFKVLKLVRIISQAMLESRLMVKRFPNNIPRAIFPYLQSYFFIDCFTLEAENMESMFKLHIETLRLMVVLCRVEELHQEIVDIIAMGSEQLFGHVKHILAYDPLSLSDSKISFNWQYAAHLINLIGYFSQDRNGVHNIGIVARTTQSFSSHLWLSYIQQITLTWLNNLVQEKIIPHLDVSITLATAIRYCDSKNDFDQELFKILLTKPEGPQYKWTQLKGVAWIKTLCQTAETRTQLRDFLETKGRNRDTKCLPSYGFINFNTSIQHSFKLNPVVDNNSPYILLSVMIDRLLGRPIDKLIEFRQIVDSIDLVRYIRIASSYGQQPNEYEPLVQESIAAQYEAVIIGKSLHLLGRYYIEMIEFEAIKEQEDSSMEVEEPGVESYGNLCHQTIGIVGLLNPRAKLTVELKDNLLQSILFVDKFQDHVFKENYLKRPNSDRVTDPQTNWVGKVSAEPTTEESLKVLVPIYLSSDQPDRFWIFQPIIDYYNDHNVHVVDSPDLNSDPSLSSKSKHSESPSKGLSPCDHRNEKWFLDTVDIRHQTICLNDLCDAQIVEILLSFHWQMMRYSIQYCKLFVRPHIEDALCCIGTIFLDDDLFLNKGVAQKICKNVEFMIKESLHGTSTKDVTRFKLFADASKMIKPINTTLGDFFTKLLDQYEAASYADCGFSNYMLLFLNMSADITFRRKLFQENDTCMRLLSRIGGDLCWAPRDLFFSTKETDKDMIRLLAISKSSLIEGSFLHAYACYHTSQ